MIIKQMVSFMKKSQLIFFLLLKSLVLSLTPLQTSPLSLSPPGPALPKNSQSIPLYSLTPCIISTSSTAPSSDFLSPPDITLIMKVVK